MKTIEEEYLLRTWREKYGLSEKEIALAASFYSGMSEKKLKNFSEKSQVQYARGVTKCT